ncbi:MAG: hypothetical protein LBP88_02165 [Treponema sp.]|jgi:hypothetical protein|nr:hypothetical protein [Treponema sp.]
MTLSVFKKLRFPFWSVLWGGLLLGSCNQDPIFYSISLEVEPVDPRIAGMPTHIVSVGDKVYAASKFNTTIHQYADSEWNELPKRPGGPILDLAATASHLYALAGEPGSAKLYRRDTSGNWESIANAANIQSIYGAEEKLFAGAMTGTSSFTMLYVDDNGGALTPLSGGSGLLQGAEYTNSTYYLAGTGIYRLENDETTLTPVKGTEGLPMVGLIALKDDNTVVGVGRKTLLTVKNSVVKAYDMGVTFTGAMALWGRLTSSEEKILLLLGIQGSSTSTTHGYREILLSSGGLGALNLRTPGADPSSVSNYDKYNSSLGKHPVLTLFQAPDGVLFAGTTKNGLWSYRDDQWNAEP